MNNYWGFLSNHGLVFEYIATHKQNVAEVMARDIGVTQRVIFMILNDLESEGYISRKKIGRCNQYEIHADLPMRHPLDMGRPVGEILPNSIKSTHPRDNSNMETSVSLVADNRK